MIHVKVEPDGPGRSKCVCGIEGDLKTLTINTIEAIHSIYRAMAEDGGKPEALELFKFRIMMAVSDPFSPRVGPERRPHLCGGEEGGAAVIKVQATPAGGEEIEVVCELDGSLEELAHETAAIINGIFNGIAEDSENVFEAAVFQAAIMEAVGDASSSVWSRREGPSC